MEAGMDPEGKNIFFLTIKKLTELTDHNKIVIQESHMKDRIFYADNNLLFLSLAFVVKKYCRASSGQRSE